MKVILVNGSPHEKGCTYTALKEVQKTLKQNNIETKIFWIGKEAISGCIACMHCAKINKCIIDDKVNEFLDLAQNYDGFIFGSPVYYANITGQLRSFLDRVFYTDSLSNRNLFYLKPGAGIVSARRSGTSASLDQINKYFGINHMPIVSSQYWNMVHGNNPEEVKQDKEGLQVMRTLGENMTYLLKCIDAGKENNIPLPKKEKALRTNFIH